MNNAMNNNNNDKDFYLEFEETKIIIKNIDIYALIKENFSQTSSISKFDINNETFIFKTEKSKNMHGYYISLNKKKYLIVSPIVFYYNINKNTYKENIFCYEYFIYLINKYKYKCPYYLDKKGEKKYIIKNSQNNYINIEMEDKEEFMFNLSKLPCKILYENNSNIKDNYILSENKFISNKSKKLKKNEENLSEKSFDKYLKEYIGNIYNTNDLFSISNLNKMFLQADIAYIDSSTPNFTFITGSDKIGKTFIILSFIRYYYYFIYFNFEKLYELEKNNNYEEIKNMVFYEISGYFFTYNDYKNFCNEFTEANKYINDKSFDFKILILDLIESFEILLNNNNNNYEKIMIIFDEFELDQLNEKKFEMNYNFIERLHNQKNNKSIICYSIISPINDNYIKKCINLWFELYRNKPLADFPVFYPPFKIDKNTNIIYFAYKYYSNGFYSNAQEYEEYKIKIKERNNLYNNIPTKYLDLVNYSLFHINKFDYIYNNTIDNTEKENKINEYIKEIEKLGDKITLSFYEDNKKLYKYDLDKVKQYNEMINKEIKINILLDMLLFIPIQLISIQEIEHCGKYDYEDEEAKPNYKVSFQYPIYEKCISKYLNSYQFPDYNDNKILKPGQKGDILEIKVIEAIDDGYFKFFKPDLKIEINSIFNLTKIDAKEEKDIVDKFKMFKNSKCNLLMITQSNPYAKRYDIGFLQKINKNDCQFITGQITRHKKPKEMEQYKNVKVDCLDISDFFNSCGINVINYHFIFIFQAGEKEDHKSMKFCSDNNIKFIKFLIKNKKPLFSDSDNNIINDIIFNNKSYSLVDQIKSNIIEDKEDSSSDYSLLGLKRYKVDPCSQAKYFYGNKIYNEIKNIIGNDFQLAENYYVLEENKYFYVYNEISEEQKLYYLYYICDKKKKIVDLLHQKKILDKKRKKKYERKLNRLITKPGLTFKCLKIISNKELIE